MKGIWKYNPWLPQVGEHCRITLGEGNTPLVRSRFIGPSMGLDNLFFKLENLNPSGSYKDRFAAMAVADLLDRQVGFCLATSSGNTGAALAAYCAAAGIACFLGIVDGAPQGKLQQMQVYGAETLMVKDFGKDPSVTNKVMEMLDSLANSYGASVQISAYQYSPCGMQGVQTLAYELAEALPGQPMQVFVPAGGGGLTLAVARGFAVWKDDYPQMANVAVHCVQPEGNDTIVTPLRRGETDAVQVSESSTVVSGLQVPNVLDGNEVIAACRASDGTGFTVTDAAVFECQQLMARKEGIFCEPAGAVSLAGLQAAIKGQDIDPSVVTVCVVSGHGFKEPVSVGRMATHTVNSYVNGVDDLFNYLKLNIQKIS